MNAWIFLPLLAVLCFSLGLLVGTVESPEPSLGTFLKVMGITSFIIFPSLIAGIAFAFHIRGFR